MSVRGWLTLGLVTISGLAWGAGDPQAASAWEANDPSDEELPAFELPELIDGMVVGGKKSKSGDWPDVTLVMLNGSACTGTLIHPLWVLTAGHCVVGSSPSTVFIGLTSYAELGSRGGITVTRDVQRAVPHPAYVNRQWGHDIALLKLDRAVNSIAPRPIATDCLVDGDLQNGDTVTIVGWGTTNVQGTAGGYELREGKTEVQTADCSANRVDGIVTGCDPESRPAGEIGAGGNGVDACFGDSGGPLYRNIGGQDYLVGVTSRAYMGVPANEPCGHGGIWTRPDSVMTWIENTIGEALPRPVCTEAPTATAGGFSVRQGGTHEVKVDYADPDGSVVAIEVASSPALGSVTVDGLTVTYTAPDDFEGDDPFTLRLIDDGSADYPDSAPGSVEVDVAARVVKGCGGCASGSPAGVAPGWAALALAGLWRRRRA
jgi:secreted trypsin-like serine protease